MWSCSRASCRSRRRCFHSIGRRLRSCRSVARSQSSARLCTACPGRSTRSSCRWFHSLRSIRTHLRFHRSIGRRLRLRRTAAHSWPWAQPCTNCSGRSIRLWCRWLDSQALIHSRPRSHHSTHPRMLWCRFWARSERPAPPCTGRCCTPSHPWGRSSHSRGSRHSRPRLPRSSCPRLTPHRSGACRSSPPCICCGRTPSWPWDRPSHSRACHRRCHRWSRSSGRRSSPRTLPACTRLGPPCRCGPLHKSIRWDSRCRTQACRRSYLLRFRSSDPCSKWCSSGGHRCPRPPCRHGRPRRSSPTGSHSRTRACRRNCLPRFRSSGLQLRSRR